MVLESTKTATNSMMRSSVSDAIGMAALEKAISIANTETASTGVTDADVTVIDITAFTNKENATTAERASVVRQVCDAAQTVGVFHVIGHGMTTELMGKMDETLRTFFKHTPVSSKLACTRGESGAVGCGYTAFKSESPNAIYGQRGPADLREALGFGPPGDSGNVYPDIEGCQATIDAYYTEMAKLEQVLCEIFSHALALVKARSDLSADFLRLAFGHHRGLLRANYYPAVAGMTLATDETRFTAHTDWSAFTLLYSHTPGLEIVHDGKWKRIPCVPGAFIVLISDLLENWSNGAFKAVIHQVNKDVSAAEDRLSIVYFPTQFQDYTEESAANVVAAVCADGEVPVFEPISITNFLKINHTKFKRAQGAFATSQKDGNVDLVANGVMNGNTSAA